MVLFYWRITMINYTTPTIQLIVEGVDITGKDVYVTFEQQCKELTKSGSDLTVSAEESDTNITFVLS